MNIQNTDKNLPLISIIIPTFNRSKWIGFAIESVMKQTYQNFELLIIDDGSTDKTQEVLKQYNNKIKYLYQENKGVSAARNLGINNAIGEYICFLDSDDRWVKNKLETQVDKIINNPDIKINFTDEVWIRKGKRVNQKKIHKKYSGWIYKRCLPLCIISPSSVMMHRKVFEKIGLFDENMTVCEDYDLWLRISSVYPVTFIEQLLIIKYGGHKDQLSQKFWGMDRFRVKALEKMLKQNDLSSENKKATIKMLHQKCDILANGFLKRDKIEDRNYYLTIKEKYTL